MSGPTVSRFSDNIIQVTRRREICPNVSEVVDLKNILSNFFKYNPRKLFSQHDFQSRESNEEEVNKSNRMTSISIFKKLYQSLGLSLNCKKFVDELTKSSIKTVVGHWPIQLDEKLNQYLLHPEMYGQQFRFCMNDEDISNESGISLSKFKLSKYEFAWKTIPGLLPDSNCIHEPFRQTPVVLRKMFREYLFLLTSVQHIRLGACSHHNEDFLSNLAKDVHLTSSSSTQPNYLNIQIQAVETTISRYLEGLIDCVLESIFSFIEPIAEVLFESTDNNVASNNEVIVQGNQSNRVIRKRKIKDISLSAEFSESQNVFTWETILFIVQWYADMFANLKIEEYQVHDMLPDLVLNTNVIERIQVRILSKYAGLNHRYISRELPTFTKVRNM